MDKIVVIITGELKPLKIPDCDDETKPDFPPIFKIPNEKDMEYIAIPDQIIEELKKQLEVVGKF